MKLIQSPYSIKHCEDTRLLCIFMKFTMILFQFSKDWCLVKIPPWYHTSLTKFLEKKGTLENMENHSVIMIFCSKENPSFLPYHVYDKLFITEVARQYNLWLHFFHEKRKKQFIPLPWNIGEFVFRNINKIDEFANHYNNAVRLKYV